MNLIGRFWIKGSITLYVMFIVAYNFFGKSTPLWTDVYYTGEKGMAFLSTMWGFKKHTLSDRMFIDYARFTQGGTWIFFIICSFNDKLWVYHQTTLVSVLILSSFGAVFVNHYLIRSSKL